MGLPSLVISLEPFFVSWFWCCSKGFSSLRGSVSSHALPCLSLCVTLNYLSLCWAHLNNHSLTYCVFHCDCLMPVVWACVLWFKWSSKLLPMIKQTCSTCCGQIVLPGILKVSRCSDDNRRELGISGCMVECVQTKYIIPYDVDEDVWVSSECGGQTPCGSVRQNISPSKMHKLHADLGLSLSLQVYWVVCSVLFSNLMLHFSHFTSNLISLRWLTKHFKTQVCSFT